MSLSLLVVDDSSSARNTLTAYLRARGVRVDEAPTYRQALALVATRAPSVVLLADDLDEGEAVRCLEDLRRAAPGLVVIFQGEGSIERTVRAIRAGAHGYVCRNSSSASVHDLVLRHAPRHPTAPILKAAATATFFESFAPSMRRLMEQTERVLEATASVLVVGAAGVGKKRLARYIHEHGPRARKPFVEVSCAGLTLELFEGAGDSTRGLLELAHGGTLVLDDIEALDKTVQRALLSAIEQSRFDVRLISTSRTDLAGESAVRRDLFYRLATVPLHVPSLRERREDVVPLARRLINSLCAASRRELVTLTPEVERALVAHAWPGNVRELKDALGRALDRATGNKLIGADLVLGERMTLAPRTRHRIEVTR